MARNAKCIEIRSADGNLMFSLRLYDETQAQGAGARAPTSRDGRPANSQRSQSGNGNGETNGDLITDAQKRYVFRILAEHGLEGDDALGHLREVFGVESLDNVTKRDASNMIERLREEAAAT